MPTYTVRNTDDDSEFEILTLWDSLQEILKKNPHFKTVITAPRIVSERGTNLKVDDGFRETMSKIKDTYKVNNIKDY